VKKENSAQLSKGKQMEQYKDLIQAASECIAIVKKNYNIQKYCQDIGLDSKGIYQGGSASKSKYVETLLEQLSKNKLLEKAEQIAIEFDNKEIRKILHHYTNNYGLKIKCEIRRAIFEEIDGIGFNLHGRRDIINFLKLNYNFASEESDVLSIFSDDSEPISSKLERDIQQHYVRNPDYTSEHVYLELLEFEYASDDKFTKIFTEALNPTIRENAAAAKELASLLNKHLLNTGYQFVEQEKGYYYVVKNGIDTTNRIINIIFAQKKDTAKPEIILDDALENKIKAVKNADNCLIYDKNISQTLTIEELKEWWESNNNIEEKLTKRMAQALSEAEKKVYDTYYNKFCVKEGKFNYSLPALLPQVYLHYDPKTIQELHGGKRILYQRMDFLILINNHRIILEIDDIKHYSDETEKGSPAKYAEMVAYDRKMRFHNYDVYRIGGYELVQENYEDMLLDLFRQLLNKYGFNK
jgi:hypothetical protein